MHTPVRCLDDRLGRGAGLDVPWLGAAASAGRVRVGIDIGPWGACSSVLAAHIAVHVTLSVAPAVGGEFQTSISSGPRC